MQPDVNGIHIFSALGRFYAFDLYRLQTYELSDTAFKVLLRALEDVDAYLSDHGLPTGLMIDEIPYWRTLIECNLIRKAPPMRLPVQQTPPFDPYVNSIMLNIAEDCNFACTYCFGQQGLYGRTKGKRMKLETGKAAIDWLIMKSGDKEELNICFFGGEPLLNITLIQSLVPYANHKAMEAGKTITYTMTTNASLLNSKSLKILTYLQVKFQVSLDGIGMENDLHRKFKNGRGTWSTIAKKLPLILQNERKITVRATLATGNVRAEKIVNELLDCGFNHVFLCPATGSDGCAITKEEGDILNHELELLAEQYIDTALHGQVMSGFLNLHQRVRRLWEPRFTFSGCGAGKHYFTVGAEGDIYVCQQLVYPDSPYRVGNVMTGEFNEEFQRLFQTIRVDDKLECSKCWARYLCANHCVAKNIRMGSGFDRADPDFCAVEMKTWELAIALSARLKQEHIRLFTDSDNDN